MRPSETHRRDLTLARHSRIKAGTIGEGVTLVNITRVEIIALELQEISLNQKDEASYPGFREPLLKFPRQGSFSMLRDKIANALKAAQEDNNQRRAATLRLITAAIMDRDMAAREQGRDGLSEEELMDLLHTMLVQREQEATHCEASGKVELAVQEREEAEMIREFLPSQLSEYEMKLVCQTVVECVEARGLRDMGRCMAELKERYPGQMDFAKASCMVKQMLRAPQ